MAEVKRRGKQPRLRAAISYWEPVPPLPLGFQLRPARRSNPPPLLRTSPMTNRGC